MQKTFLNSMLLKQKIITILKEKQAVNPTPIFGFLKKYVSLYRDIFLKILKIPSVFTRLFFAYHLTYKSVMVAWSLNMTLIQLKQYPSDISEIRKTTFPVGDFDKCHLFSVFYDFLLCRKMSFIFGHSWVHEYLMNGGIMCH